MRGVLLAALASVAGAPFEASARGDLEALFAAADADPRGVAPLIVEASATISSLDSMMFRARTTTCWPASVSAMRRG
jgi:hypothetical protein